MSESVEMYLIKIVILRKDDRPVPLSLLAQGLEISSVSVNEMCRKLMGEGLLTYEPYKGVTLTEQGEQLAQRVLRRRRLWEVFLVEKLHIDPLEAEEISCRFEHVTPDDVAERLAIFVGNPLYSPQNKPIPPGDSKPVSDNVRPLIRLSAGEHGQIAVINTDSIVSDFLHTQGIVPHLTIAVLAVGADGTLLIEANGRRLSISRSIAECIGIADVETLNVGAV